MEIASVGHHESTMPGPTKAFHGELLTKDHDDEPASVLLAIIQAEQ